MELLGHRVDIYSWEIARQLSKVCVLFAIPTSSVMRISVLPYPCLNLVLSFCFNFSHPRRCEIYLILVSPRIFLRPNVFKIHLFLRNDYSHLCLWFYWYLFFCNWFVTVLCMFRIKVFITDILSIFCPRLWLDFSFS